MRLMPTPMVAMVIIWIPIPQEMDMLLLFMVTTTSLVDVAPLLLLDIMLAMETSTTSDMDTPMDMERCWTKLLTDILFTLGPSTATSSLTSTAMTMDTTRSTDNH